MIVLDEDSGVKRIREIYGLLKKELDLGEEIVIDFGRVNRIDLAVAQVIIAAGREARARGKAIRIKTIPETVKVQLNLCGLKI